MGWAVVLLLGLWVVGGNFDLAFVLAHVAGLWDGQTLGEDRK